jgi:hypothetical protein
MIQTLFNKAKWKKGPWNDEPDLAMWVDVLSFYPCVARRGLFGEWCGYVGLPPHHPLYGVNRYDRVFEFIDVHNNITQSDISEDLSKLTMPPIAYWWLGFSCSGRNDFVPAQPIATESEYNVYRTFEYVQGQIESLSSQLSLLDTNLMYDDFAV